MSHFYAEIQGSRGRASRCGDKSSGHWGWIRGWTAGIEVIARRDEKEHADRFEVWQTGGSNGRSMYQKHLGTLVHYDGEKAPKWLASGS